MNAEHLTWFRSSYSGSGGGNCVEVAMPPATVHVRDSKVPQGPVLTFAATEWTVFVTFARASSRSVSVCLPVMSGS
jgi:hypothetical protein